MAEDIKTSGPYSQWRRAGDLIFVSGQSSSDPRTGKMRGDNIEEQTKQALENIKAILGINGATLKDVVKVTVVLTDVTNFKRMNEVYRTFFSEPFPARICSGGQLASPNMLVEIDAVAYLRE